MIALASTAPTGSFVEVGVYQGGTALRLYALAETQGRALHLFDTFTGMPFWDENLDIIRPGAFSDINLDEIRKAMPKAEIYQGIYPATHPAELSDVAFVHCDVDQYQSYRAVIDTMWDSMVKGGMMLFDDYPYLAGAKRAVEETFLPSALYRTPANRFYVVKD